MAQVVVAETGDSEFLARTEGLTGIEHPEILVAFNGPNRFDFSAFEDVWFEEEIARG